MRFCKSEFILRRVSYNRITVIFSGIFDCYVGCSGLKRTAICTFCRAMCDTFVNFECVRMHWLNRAAGLVAEVESAFIGPLRSAFDTAIEAESFALWVN